MRIKELVAPTRTFMQEIKRGFGVGTKTDLPFIGTVERDSFSMRRDIRYRNSFLPRIRGQINDGPIGAHISVTMFLHPLVAVFMVLWFSGVGIGSWALFHAPGGQVQASFIPVAMLVFGAALVCGGFFPEAIKARRLLEEAFSKTGA